MNVSSISRSSAGDLSNNCVGIARFVDVLCPVSVSSNSSRRLRLMDLRLGALRSSRKLAKLLFVIKTVISPFSNLVWNCKMASVPLSVLIVTLFILL